MPQRRKQPQREQSPIERRLTRRRFIRNLLLAGAGAALGGLGAAIEAKLKAVKRRQIRRQHLEESLRSKRIKHTDFWLEVAERYSYVFTANEILALDNLAKRLNIHPALSLIHI